MILALVVTFRNVKSVKHVSDGDSGLFAIAPGDDPLHTWGKKEKVVGLIGKRL